MGMNQWQVLMLFPRSFTSLMARSTPRSATTPFFWRMLVSQQAPPEQRHQRRECFGNSLLLNRKVPLTSSNKWINWRGRQKRLKGSLRSSKYSNRRSTISYVRISCASALLLVTLSRQLCWLAAVNICGLMCVLVCWFDVVKLSVDCCWCVNSNLLYLIVMLNNYVDIIE